MVTKKYKDKDISILGFGAMRFPTIDGKIDYKESEKMIDLAYSEGVNYFDTAPIYHDGQSEEFLGYALEKYDRKSYSIADKLSAWLVKDLDGVKELVEKELKKLKTDHFDFYLCHSLNENNFSEYESKGYLKYLDELKKQGVIKNLGFSYHGLPTYLKTIVDSYKFDFCQLQINYYDWTLQDAKLQYDTATNAGLPVAIMEPVRGGMLADLSPTANKILQEGNDNSVASWAVKYGMSLDNCYVLLSGMSNMEQVKDNIKTAKNFKKLTEKDYDTIERALVEFRKEQSIPCTSCKYCIDCPKGIDIPKNFEVYNGYLRQKDDMHFERSYSFSIPKETNADKCIDCNKCMEHCPQKIEITKHLKEIAQAYVKAGGKLD